MKNLPHKMVQSHRERSPIANHVFSGSTTMIGVCITVTALFRVLKTSMSTYADEILSIDTFLFITAALCSYLSLRKKNDRQFELIADICFFIGMFVMVVVGVMIVFVNVDV